MVDKRAVRRGYDELAEQYDGWRDRDGRGLDLVADLVASLPADARLLDAGCGGGRPVLARASEAVDAVGLDFSREQLRLAGRNAPSADRVQGDMTALPLSTAGVDAVVAYWSLIHVPLADHQPVLDEFARVLRPGGRLLLCEGRTEWVGENPDWLDSGTGMAWEIAGAATTERQVRAAGFTVTGRWGVPESVSTEADDSDATASDADDSDAATDDGEAATAEESTEPWIVFGARLDG
jgi:ubiquinone/menaquinone biosynthesis C-methylase UbiE